MPADSMIEFGFSLVENHGRNRAPASTSAASIPQSSPGVSFEGCR
jgi:hypothetical protein